MPYVADHSTSDIPVRGGDLRVGTWASEDVVRGALPTRLVLAVHGVTANHTAWWPLARRLTATSGTVLWAPDLRGRGRSNGLPGPWGMATHADDLAAVLDRSDVERVDVVGHSMGGFVAVAFAARHPDRVARLVLVDGGVPLPRPAGVSAQDALTAVLGPAAARLSMTFDSAEAYRDFFRRHPAVGPLWNDDVERYVDYDLAGGRSSVSYEAVAADSAELGEDGPVVAAWERIHQNVPFLRAPRGLLADPPGLYPPDVLAAFVAGHPNVEARDVEDVDHYGITLSDRGAEAVVSALVDA